MENGRDLHFICVGFQEVILGVGVLVQELF